MSTRTAVVLSYVICAKCGDPVGGRIPQPPQELKLTCLHCKQTFTFEPEDVGRGVVSYDPLTGRWKTEGLDQS
jgi:hypothetical protein